jgi:hypothetical protein
MNLQYINKKRKKNVNIVLLHLYVILEKAKLKR